jgi:hypothetical protein
MHVVYTGTTRRGQELPFVHFLVTFYAVIRDVRRANLDDIDYGIGHGAGKGLRGCLSVPTHGYALSGDPDRRPVLARAAALLAECGPATRNESPESAADCERPWKAETLAGPASEPATSNSVGVRLPCSARPPTT